MHDQCERTHCEWANSPTGNCFWDKSRCPHLIERLEAAEKQKLTRKTDIDKWRAEREADAKIKEADKKQRSEHLKEYQREYHKKRKEMKAVDERKGRIDSKILSDDSGRNQTVSGKAKRPRRCI